MRPEVIPFLLVALGIGVVLMLIMMAFRARRRTALIAGGALALVLGFYLLWFFRDPERTSPSDPALIVSAADGRIVKVTDVPKAEFITICKGQGLTEEKIAKLGRLTQEDSVRISVFLSLFDVHVNRMPFSGKAEFLGYFEGKHIVTFDDKSSSENQHSSVAIHSDKTSCLLNQIVGPIARRVIYWPDNSKVVEMPVGEKIGMMLFGSRLDVYFPKADIDVQVKEGDRVQAGLSILARLKKGP